MQQTSLLEEVEPRVEFQVKTCELDLDNRELDQFVKYAERGGIYETFGEAWMALAQTARL